MGSTAVRIARWVPAAGWAGVIFWLSSKPSTGLPGPFSPAAHFVAYAILGALLWLALGGMRGSARAAVVAVVLASLYGITDEYHQSFVPNRMPDPVDWIVDTLGALTAVLALTLVARRRAVASAAISTAGGALEESGAASGPEGR